MKRFFPTALVATAALPFVALAAAGPTLEGRVTEYTLPNGMRWFFVERHTSPTFTGVIMFRVGGVDEEPGKTGLAHLFEHMAFKGTTVIGTRDYEAEKDILAAIEDVADRLTAARAAGDEEAARALQTELASLQEKEKALIVKDEFWEIYLRNGASGLNAWTSKDVTTYHISLPANRLELYAAMESERLADPVFREFYIERDVVLEEYRLRVATNPDGKLYEQFIAAAFDGHPYEWLTLGNPDDLAKLSAADARAFYAKYYTAANAVGVLVGDFDTDEAKKTVAKYFGRLSPGMRPTVTEVVSARPDGERRVEVPFDAEPRLLIGYHIPTYPDRDAVVLNVISSLLAGGRSARLYQRLVEELGVAADVACYTEEPGERLDHLFTIEATPRAPHTAAEVEAAIYAELEKLAVHGPSRRELEKIKNQVDATLLRRLGSNAGMAHTIAYYQTVFGNWRYIYEYRSQLRKVKPADVMRVVQKYFRPANRTVAVLVKKAEADE